MLRYALGQLIDYDPITESSRNFDLNGLGLLDLVMPNAVYGSRDQLLVAWDRLLLQPHVQLVLDVLHFEFGIASHSRPDAMCSGFATTMTVVSVQAVI